MVSPDTSGKGFMYLKMKNLHQNVKKQRNITQLHIICTIWLWYRYNC